MKLRAVAAATLLVVAGFGAVIAFGGTAAAATNEAPEVVGAVEYDGNVELTFADGVVQNNAVDGPGLSGSGGQLNERNVTVYVDGTAYDDPGDFDVNHSDGTAGNGEDVTLTLVPQDSWGDLAPDQDVTVHVDAVQADVAGGPVATPGNQSVLVTSQVLQGGGPNDTQGSAATVEQGTNVALRGSQGEDIDVGEVGGSTQFDSNFGNATVRAVNTSTYNTGATYRASFGASADQYFDVTAPKNVSFGRETYTEQRGDVAAIDLSLSNATTATVTIGDVDEFNWSQNVTVEDGDGDGAVTLEFNTYTAGSSGDTNANGQAYTVYSVADAGDSITNVAPASGLFDPTAPAEATLSASDYPVRAVTGTTPAAEVAGGPTATATLRLQPQSTDAVTNYVAPAPRGGDLDSPAAIAAMRADGNVTEVGEVAVGDLLVAEIEASGLEGVIRNRTTTVADNVTEAFLTERPDSGGGAGAAFDLHVNVTNPGPTADEYSVGLSPVNATVVPDPANDTYWLVVDTAALGEDAGDELETSFGMRAESSLTDAGDRLVADAWSLVEPAVTLSKNTVIDGETGVTVRNATGQTFDGTATVAPGTELTIEARNTGNDPLLVTATTRVEPDGAFTAVGDFDHVTPVRDFTVTVQRDDTDLLDELVDGRVLTSLVPNLTISGIEPTTLTLPADGTLAVNATVANVGTGQTNESVRLAVAERDVSLSRTVDLDPDENAIVPLALDAASIGLDEGESYTFVVEAGDDSESGTATVADAAPAFAVSNLDPTLATADAGENVSVSATVENTGSANGTETVDVRVDGSTVATEGVDLAPGEETTVEFALETAGFDGAVEYAVAAGDDEATGVVVVDADDGSDADEDDGFDPGDGDGSDSDAGDEAPTVDVAVTDTTAPVTVGDALVVSVVVENVGDAGERETVALAVDGQRRDEQAISVPAGESRVVALEWATADGDAGDHVASVTAGSATDAATVTVAPDLEDSAVTVDVAGTTSPVAAGEVLGVVAEVTNAGSVATTETVTLSVDGDRRANATVDLSAGQRRSVALEWATGAGDRGNHTVSVATDGDSAATVVEVGSTAGPSLAIDGPEPSAVTVAPGEAVNATVTVTNTGSVAVSEPVELRVDGRATAARTLRLDGGESATATFALDAGDLDAGTYAYTVAGGGDYAAGVVTVATSDEDGSAGDGDTTETIDGDGPPTATDSPAGPASETSGERSEATDPAAGSPTETGSGGSGPGFGVAAAALALVAAGLFARRRH